MKFEVLKILFGVHFTKENNETKKKKTLNKKPPYSLKFTVM